MTPQPPLTRRQRQILDFYQGYTEEHQLSPTLEEVAQHFGLNKVTIFGHVSELERKGALVRSGKGISRALQLPDDDPDGTVAAARDGYHIPLLGRIAAGAPLEVLEYPESFNLGDLVPKDQDVYALRVTGDSMIEDGIHDGDLVIVEPRKTAKPGATIVAILPGDVTEETTLKRYYPMKNGVRLEPANSSLAPIFAPSIEIRGVVIGVIRQLPR
jgi:repressor LexA